MARTDNLTNFLTDVADAIKEKKGDDTPIPASEFDTEIANLPSGGDISEYVNLDYLYTSNSNWTSYMKKNLPLAPLSPDFKLLVGFFENYKGLSLDVSPLNTENVASMQYMFKSCDKLTTLDLSAWDTSNVDNMYGMFQMCSNLATLNMQNLDMGKVTIATEMFTNCSNLTNLTFGNNYGKAFTNTTTNYNSYAIKLNVTSKLTKDSIMSVINNVYDLHLAYQMNGKTFASQKIALGGKLSNLSADEIAIATEKGWTVTSS